MIGKEEKSPEENFTKDRIIRIVLNVETRNENIQQILTHFEKIVIEAIQNREIEKWIKCMDCKESKPGYFSAEKGMGESFLFSNFGLFENFDQTKIYYFI